MVEEVRRQVKELRGDAYDEKSGADGQDDDQWTVFKNDIAEAKHNVDFWNKELVRLKEENEKKSDEIFATPPEKYAACIKIATDASLQEMIAPGCLVIFTPIIVGFFFGVQALAGLLAGSLVSSVQMAISASNSGGAWDNAKKYISGQNL